MPVPVPVRRVGRHYYALQRLCKTPPVVLQIAEANGWWAWGQPYAVRQAHLDHAKRRLLHLLYIMRDAAFDCDENRYTNETRACFLVHEHERLVEACEHLVQALGGLWRSYGGEPDFTKPVGLDGRRHSNAVEVLAQVLGGAFESMRWNTMTFVEAAARNVCLAYAKSLGIVLVSLRLLPSSMRSLCLPSRRCPELSCRVNHNDEILMGLMKRPRWQARDDACPRWGALLFRYARCVCVCFRHSLSLEHPPIAPNAHTYHVFVSLATQKGLGAIRDLITAAETQMLHCQPETQVQLQCAWSHWRRVAAASHHGLFNDADAIIELEVSARIGADPNELRCMPIRCAVGREAHLESPPYEYSRGSRSNRLGRGEVVHTLARRAGMHPGKYHDARCWPLVCRAKAYIPAGVEVDGL